MQKTQVWSLSWEDPLEKEMAARSSILAWEILWSEEPGGLQSKGLQKVRRDLEAKQQGIIYQNLSIQLSTGYLICFRLGWLWKPHEHSLSFFKFYLGCAGSLLLPMAFSSCRESGLLSSCRVWVSCCSGFFCCGARALGVQASVIVVNRLSCPTACGIFQDQGLNYCPLHCKADS